MRETVIRAEKIGKLYRIGKRESYNSLRDTLMQALQAPFRVFTSNGTGPNDYSVWALKEISFEVQRGEVLGIIGNNGAGKSTLLKILSRITSPTEGFAEVCGRVGSLLEVGTGFNPELTGRENIYLNGAILGMKRAEIRKRFDEIVAFAEVEKFIDTPVKRYSTGMYMRLAFGIAAHLQPEILLVDEVLAVGDIAFQGKCLGKIGEVAKGGRTVLMVSHNMAAVRGLCGSAMWIDQGRLIKNGPTREVVSCYEDSRLKDISGSTSVIERRRTFIDDEYHVKRIEMRNGDGELTATFRYGETMVLMVDLAGESPSNRNSIEFRIFGEVGDPIKTIRFIAVGASGPFHGIYFGRGDRRIKIEIGPLTLTNGRYALSLSMLSNNVRVDTWEDACSFVVMDCDPFAQGHYIQAAGCVVPHTFALAD